MAPELDQAALDAAVRAVEEALCAMEWPAVRRNAEVVVPIDNIARLAVATAAPIIAAAEWERIAAWVEAECVDLDDDDQICEGCEDTAACIRRGDLASRLTGSDPAAIARAGTSEAGR